MREPDERGHIQHGSDRGPTAPDQAFAAHHAAVPIHRGDPDEGRDLMPREMAQLWQRGEEGECGDLADAGDTPQQVRFRLVERTGRDGVLPVAIDVREPLHEPADVLADVAFDRPTGEAEAILLGREHVDDLAAACQPAVEEERGFIRQGPWLGPDTLGEVGEEAGVEGIGLARPWRG